jgi:hypothetical protein
VIPTVSVLDSKSVYAAVFDFLFYLVHIFYLNQRKHLRFKMMAENGTVWKSDYPKRHIYFLGTLGLLLGLGIIVLEVKDEETFTFIIQPTLYITIYNLQATMVVYRDDIRLNDIRNNPLLPIAITGLTFGVYFVVLAIVTACAAKSKSRCM